MPSQRPPRTAPPVTPDGRYIVVDGVLWRCSNPALDEATRKRLTDELMDARRQVGVAERKGDARLTRKARDAVDAAKTALGERGAPWWEDGAPDFSRHKIENTPYADWWQRRERRGTRRRQG